MKWTLEYTNQALKFLEKRLIDSVDILIKKAVRKVIFFENINIDIKKMKGEWQEFYRIRQGDLRIIIKFETENRVVLIYRIGLRGNIYK